MFGFGDEDDETSDAALLKAVRKRILSEVSSPREAAAAKIINKVYGGGGGGGVMDRLGHQPQMGGEGGEDPFDYFVNIQRKDLPDINPETGKPIGWEKTVHRYREPKGGGEGHGKKKKR